ncbi:HpcH/HpaI aldolase/citrate lyase family protein [Yinghuangia soli]|uniref:CoA ester lyase n=1 Tax=Yinghuangia soli TaxID=2908204 RepID=A0AA41U1W3_9ACTN|nr:CoA ester lyase [Yinghuangia soli]MCF2526499.1 CoA ester lyase [Yinghuangia soli]
MSARSYLYVPGDAPGKLAKAFDRGADALIVDLEDAVAPSAKEAARRNVAAWLADARPGDTEIWVRVNAPSDVRKADVAAVAVSPLLTGIFLPRVEHQWPIIRVVRQLRKLRSEAVLCPMIETATALSHMELIGSGPRVARLQLGEVDLCAELGVTPGDDGRELLYVRTRLVIDSMAAGIGPPLAPVDTDFRDLDRLRTTSEEFKRMGYRGRACIHPAQVPVVNEAFTPTQEELARAWDIVERHGAAVAAGNGVCLDAEGRMVDEAVVRRARSVLDLRR